jgi:hypothetical protein
MGATPEAAVAAAVERLGRQLSRVRGIDLARRDERAVINAALAELGGVAPERPAPARKPPEEREVVHRRTYADGPVATLTAVADLLDLDQLFYLFVHGRTGEDVVVYWRDDHRIGLLHPQGSPLADEDDIVIAEPSRYSGPLTLDQARSEMDVLHHRFLYFHGPATDRGEVLYLRRDGDYGLVEPAPFV